jgi:predicted 3-demethylubiquinone-9 3-methyltransferase (glyoxalase superfamily)
VQKIVTNLWFDAEAEDAAKYYTSIFKNSKIVDTLTTERQDLGYGHGRDLRA